MSEEDHEVTLRPLAGSCCCGLHRDAALSEDSVCLARFDFVFLSLVPRRPVGPAGGEREHGDQVTVMTSASLERGPSPCLQNHPSTETRRALTLGCC